MQSREGGQEAGGETGRRTWGTGIIENDEAAETGELGTGLKQGEWTSLLQNQGFLFSVWPGVSSLDTTVQLHLAPGQKI